MSGEEFIYIGIGIIAADVILFALFQVFMRRWIKAFKETWKKY